MTGGRGRMADTNITDPLGNTLVLHDTTWYGHIVRFGNHPELARYRADVERAVAQPTCIHVSAQDPDCRLYFGPVSGRPGLHVKVVGDVAQGIVKTAHFVRTLPGGAPLWP